MRTSDFSLGLPAGLFPNLLHVATMIVITIIVIDGVEIRRLLVPRWVENGTEESVVLDCDYVYNENDLRLVVKWFFGDSLEPVYQWIPELNSRQMSGVLKERLDWNFSVNYPDAYSRYRALKIIRPTIELSGKYTCLVTSLAGQDTREQNMVVYVPARHFDLSFSESSDSEMNVTCEAHGLFPLPELKLVYSRRRTNEDKMMSSTDVSRTVERQPNGTYDVAVHRTFFASDLSSRGDLNVECSLELPGTNYARTKRIEYFPDVPAEKFETSSASVCPWFSGMFLIALFLVRYETSL